MGFQNPADLKAYFEIGEITVEENEFDFSAEELAYTGLVIANGTGLKASTGANGDSFGGGIGSAIENLALDFGDVRKWITVGLKIWDIVKANQLVINVKT